MPRITLIPLKEKVRELELIYYKAQKEIGVALLSIDPANYRELTAIKAQEKINMLIRKLNRASTRWVNEAVPQAYEKSFIVARTNLEILGAEKDNSFSMKTHRFAIDDYIEKTMKNLITANQSIKVNVNTYLYIVRRASSGLMQFQHFGVADDEAISEIIMDTIELGRERAYASTRIHEYLRLQLLDGQFISKAGRNYNLRDYSKMVARTRLRQAQTDAVKNTCKQYENDLVQWSSHASPCPQCAPLEGRIFSLSGTHLRYPLLTDEPPLHPNCLADRNNRVLTNKGLIPIYKIKEGDMVFTHKGRFKPVSHIMKRNFRGQLIWINGLGITYNHKMFTDSGLIPVGNLTRDDTIFELSPESMRKSKISLNPNYFPSQRRKNSVPLSIILNSIIMSSAINLKSNITNGKINDICINNFLLNKINIKFFEYISDKFSHFRLFFQKCFSKIFSYFLPYFWITRRIVINHSNFVFPICFRFGIGNSFNFKSSNRSSFNSKIFKNILNPMSISRANSDNFSNIKKIFTRIISIGNYFFKRFFKSGLNFLNPIQELFSLSTSERTGFGIPSFDRISTDRAIVHDDSFIKTNINQYSPKMLAYSGEVVNIEVQDDHSYITEGFLVKNCEHDLSPTSEVAIEFRGVRV